MRNAGVVASLICLLGGSASAPALESVLNAKRMGAFQCLSCPKGGFLYGVRSGSFGRVIREIPAGRSLCTLDFHYVDGQQYLRFLLDGERWPDDGTWGVRADSWNAQCHVK